MPAPASPDPRSAPTPSKQRRLPPLLRRAWYGLNQAFRQRIAHLAITPDQFSILRWLSEGDPVGLTQREITDLMASDPNTITSTLARMEVAGLISRDPHEKDRRANRVTMRAKGAKAFRQATLIAVELQNHIVSVLPANRRAKFLEDLDAIAEACVASVEKPAGRRGE